MIQLTTSNGTFGLVEVPKDAIDPQVYNNAIGYNTPIMDFWVGFVGVHEKEIDLPPGNWTFLFTTKDATDEDWKKVGEKPNLDPEKNYAVLQLNK